MKKKLIAASAGVVASGALFFGGAPYYFGGQAEQVLADQYRLLQENGFLTVESRRYERGWFESTETLEVRLKPSLLNNAGNYLPDNLKTVLSEPVTVINHVKHGPFADGLQPAAARVESEFRYSPEAGKVLKRFFGEQAPVTLTNTIGLGGGGRMRNCRASP